MELAGVWWRWALQEDAERTGKEYDYDYDYDYEGGGMRLLYSFRVKHPCQRDIIDIHWGFRKNKCEHKCEQTRDDSTQRMKDEACNRSYRKQTADWGLETGDFCRSYRREA